MAPNSWKKHVRQQLPLLGHRNWIAVVDSAYPWQTAPGIETLVTGEKHLVVLDFVLRNVSQAGHVRPLLYVDAELASLPEKDAPGIEPYRGKLQSLLRDQQVSALPHDEIIARFNQTAAHFRILILKTTFTLPYTSVFVQLECGYWSEEAEKRLRAGLRSKAK